MLEAWYVFITPRKYIRANACICYCSLAFCDLPWRRRLAFIYRPWRELSTWIRFALTTAVSELSMHADRQTHTYQRLELSRCLNATCSCSQKSNCVEKSNKAWNEMNEWKCGDLKCVQKPTRGRLSLTHLPVQPLSMVRESV